MFPTLSLAAVLLVPAAPLPQVAERTVSAPPMILQLKPDADGKVRVTVQRTVTRKVKSVIRNGNNVQQVERAVPITTQQTVELHEIQDLQISTTDGKALDVKDLVNRIASGAPVIASSDGQKVSPEYLSLFRDGVIVLVSPELKAQTLQARPRQLPGGGIIGPGQRQPLPAPIAAPIQNQRGVIQAVPLQKAPAIIPAPAVEPANPK